MNPAGLTSRKIYFTLLWLMALLLAGAAGARAQENPPKPGLFVSFQQSTLHESEPLGVVVWLSNDSDQDLTGLQLHIAGPAFLHWYAGDCSGPESGPLLSLGALPAHTVRSQALCARYTSGASVGTFNLSFTLQYAWSAGGQAHVSLVNLEKSLTIDLFGVDNILGIPLAFAGFIVPGLFLIRVLRWFSVPFTLKLETDDKLILGVLASVAISGLALGLHRLVNWSWLDYLDLSSTISIAKFLALAFTGMLLGLAGGGYYAWRLDRKRRAEQAKLIKVNDSLPVLLTKLLELNPDYTGSPVLVSLKNGAAFAGSHYAESTDFTYLAGSFQIDRQTLDQEFLDKIAGCLDQQGSLVQETASLLEFLKALVEKPGLKITTRAQVEHVQPGPRGFTLKEYLAWKKDEVSSITSDVERQTPELLVLAN